MADDNIHQYERRETVVKPGEQVEYSRQVVAKHDKGISPATVAALVLAAVAVAIALMLFLNQRRQDEQLTAATQATPTPIPQPTQNVTVIPVPQIQTVPVPVAPPVSSAPAAAPSPRETPVDDNTIEQQVRQRLLDASVLAGATIEVKVTSGHVTLDGEVTNPSMKTLAEQLAKRVKGVKDVTNLIDVKLPKMP